MPGWKEYKGAAGALTLAAGISDSDTSILTLGGVTGWPTGALHPFVVTLDAGNAGEEKVLCSARSGNTITATERGYDGTTASAHSIGSPVEHRIDSDSLETFAAHAFDTSRDDHAQYILVDGTRAFTDVDGIVATPTFVGTVNNEGTSDDLARADHVHALGAGSIDDSALFAAGVVNAAAIGTGEVGADEIAASAVTAAELAADAVTTVKILDAQVTAAKLAADAVTTVKIANAQVTPAKVADGGLGGPRGAAVTGGPVGGSAVELASLTIPAQPFAYTLDAAAFWSAYNSDDDEAFSLAIKVDGTTRGKVYQRHTGGSGTRYGYAIPCIELVQVAATTACVVTVVAIRETGAGNLTEQQAGRLVATLYTKQPAT